MVIDWWQALITAQRMAKAAKNSITESPGGKGRNLERLSADGSYANVAIVCLCEHRCLYHTINSTAAPVSHFTSFAALPSRNETS